MPEAPDNFGQLVFGDEPARLAARAETRVHIRAGFESRCGSVRLGSGTHRPDPCPHVAESDFVGCAEQVKKGRAHTFSVRRGCGRDHIQAGVRELS